jgi:hypothetical protein
LAALVLTFPFVARLAAYAGPRDNDSLEQVGEELWSWRVGEAPFIGDDVPRLVHPRGSRDWSAASIPRRQTELSRFEARLQNLRPEDWPVHKQVDYELLQSVLARVRWEPDINPRWKRDPTFYVQQTLTPVLELIPESSCFLKQRESPEGLFRFMTYVNPYAATLDKTTIEA